MWGSIGLWLISKLSGINVSGVVQSAVTAYTAKVNAGTDSAKIDASLIAREADLAQREAELQASLAKNEPGYVRQAFAYPVAIYYGKLFVIDKVLGLGVTDGLSPELTWVAQTIIVSYFGSATVVGVAKLIAARTAR